MAAAKPIRNAYRSRKNKIILTANICGSVTSKRRLKAYEHFA
jgi:hypothetical protein